MDNENVAFDPFVQGNLKTAFSAAKDGARSKLLCVAVREMAGGLKGVSIVADLAFIDRQNYIRGLRLALDENPKNLTAARALIWLFVRESLFQEARKCYLDIEQHWQNYNEIFLEHTRTLIVSAYDEAAAYLEQHRSRFKGASLVSYELQTSSSPSAEAARNGRLALVAYSARAFRDMLIGDNANTPVLVKQSEKRALWRMVEVATNANRIALVGNAPNLLGGRLGETIDNFDVVIRCNFPTIDGFEQDVGSRTDLVVFNETLRERLPTIRNKSPRFLNCLSIGLHPEPTFGLPTDVLFESEQNVGTLPAAARTFLSEVCYSRCTTGLMAINLLVFLLGKKVSLFGFDFFSDAARAHYFGPQTGAYLGHELQYEQWFVTKFLAEQFGDLVSFGAN